MQGALSLAKRGLGQVAPNPAVGCLLVRGGQIVGRGWTQPGGRPHAETVALERAGPRAKGATAYVTLEPCSHHGRTLPCADALIRSGVARCVVACGDSDKRVNGKGLQRLADAGILVETGLCALQARAVNAGFFCLQEKKRPLVTVKIATSLDGRIATKSGHSQWITGPLARRRVQVIRAQQDALLVGSGTAVTDDPRLDVRLQGLKDRSPRRFVMDSRLRLPLTSHLVRTAQEIPSGLITLKGNDRARLAAYKNAGMSILTVGRDQEGLLSLHAALEALGELGITRLMVEGGSHLLGNLFRSDLVDRLIWFQAPRVIGGDALPAVAGFGLERLEDQNLYQEVQSLSIGPDRMICYERLA